MKIVEIKNCGVHDLQFEKVVTLERITVKPGQTVRFRVQDCYARCYNYLNTLYAVVRVSDEVKKVAKPVVKEIKPTEKVEAPKPTVTEETPKPTVTEETPKVAPKKRRRVTL